jgi:hypothetical protein
LHERNIKRKRKTVKEAVLHFTWAREMETEMEMQAMAMAMAMAMERNRI